MIMLRNGLAWIHELPRHIRVLGPTLGYLEIRKLTLIVKKAKMGAWKS